MDFYGIYSDRLHSLKERLSIAGTQASKWLKFEASVKAALNVSPRTDHKAVGRSVYPSLPVALDSELQKTVIRVEACRVLLESVEALYAVLNDKQRRTADRLLLPILTDVLGTASNRYSLAA